jgi:hypothetical protein
MSTITSIAPNFRVELASVLAHIIEAPSGQELKFGGNVPTPSLIIIVQTKVLKVKVCRDGDIDTK